MTAIEHLNQRLADGLGLSPGSTYGRFAWKFSTELSWYFREGIHENFQRQNWADRIGRVWLMCERRLPTGCDVTTGHQYPLSESQWWQMFHGSIPYPRRGEYTPYPETRLRPGQ